MWTEALPVGQCQVFVCYSIFSRAEGLLLYVLHVSPAPGGCASAAAAPRGLAACQDYQTFSLRQKQGPCPPNPAPTRMSFHGMVTAAKSNKSRKWA